MRGACWPAPVWGGGFQVTGNRSPYPGPNLSASQRSNLLATGNQTYSYMHTLGAKNLIQIRPGVFPKKLQAKGAKWPHFFCTEMVQDGARISQGRQPPVGNLASPCRWTEWARFKVDLFSVSST